MKTVGPENVISNSIRLVDLTVYPTFQCNLNCSYCAHKSEKSKFHKDMDTRLSYENFYNLTQFVRAYRHPDDDLNIMVNGGEPTLDWEYFYNYSLILKMIPKVKLHLISNFTLEYNKEQFDFINSLYDTVAVSLDGEKGVHDLERGEGSYDKTMSNIVTFAARFPGKISINKTITEKNVDTFAEEKKLLDLIGIANNFTIDFFTHKDNEKYFVQTLLKEFGKLALERKALNFISFLSRDDQYCNDKHLFMSVFPTGEIAHCGIQYDPNKVFFDLNNFPKMVLNKDNFDKIKTTGLYDDECKTCKAKDFCSTGCYAAFEESRQVFCSIMYGIGMLQEEIKVLGEKNEICSC